MVQKSKHWNGSLTSLEGKKCNGAEGPSRGLQNPTDSKFQVFTNNIECEVYST